MSQYEELFLVNDTVPVDDEMIVFLTVLDKETVDRAFEAANSDLDTLYLLDQDRHYRWQVKSITRNYCRDGENVLFCLYDEMEHDVGAAKWLPIPVDAQIMMEHEMKVSP